MFEIKEKGLIGLLFFVISFSAVGVVENPPIYAVKSTLIPIEQSNGKINVLFFMLNCTICLIFLVRILKKVDEQYLMKSYLLSRTSKQQAFVINFIRIFKDTFLVLLIKIIVDIVFSQMKELNDFVLLLSFSASTFLTLIFWILLAYFVREICKSAKISFFTTIVLIFSFQFAGLFAKPFALVSIASPSYVASPAFWLILKTIFVSFFGTGLFLFYMHEQKNNKTFAENTQVKGNSVMIKVENATKVLSKNQVLTNINLTLEQGECVLLKGHNGCGKTMLLRLLCGLMQPTEGSVTFSEDYRFGVIIETPTFFLNETVLYNLKYLASINKLIDQDTIEMFLKRLNLYDNRNMKVRKLSLGMKQRLAICQSFMENPDVLLLDEPFNAIDDENLKVVYEMIKENCDDGKLVVVASHGDTGSIDFFQKEYIMNNGKIMQ